MGGSSWDEFQNGFVYWASSDAQYECAYCLIRYPNLDALHDHVPQVHRVRWEKYEKDNPHFLVREVPLVCKMCGETPQILEEHLKSQHAMGAELYFVR